MDLVVFDPAKASPIPGSNLKVGFKKWITVMVNADIERL
jgi:hypothetical protein